MKNIEIKFDFNGHDETHYGCYGEVGLLRGTTNLVNGRYFPKTSNLTKNSSIEEIKQWKEEFKAKATNWILNKKIA